MSGTFNWFSKALPHPRSHPTLTTRGGIRHSYFGLTDPKAEADAGQEMCDRPGTLPCSGSCQKASRVARVHTEAVTPGHGFTGEGVNVDKATKGTVFPKT